MKTELIPPTPTEPTATKFPVLARNKANGFVVLFTDDHIGMVLEDGGGEHYSVGHYGSGWTRFNSSAVWEILPAGTKLVITQ